MSKRALRLERVFRDRSNHPYLEDDIVKHYRFPRVQILILLDLLRANLKNPMHHSQAVPVEIQVCDAAD